MFSIRLETIAVTANYVVSLLVIYSLNAIYYKGSSLSLGPSATNCDGYAIGI